MWVCLVVLAVTARPSSCGWDATDRASVWLSLPPTRTGETGEQGEQARPTVLVLADRPR